MRIKITILSLGALAAGFVVGAVAQASAGAAGMAKHPHAGGAARAYAADEAYEATPAQVPTFTPTPGPVPGPSPTVPSPSPSPAPSPTPTIPAPVPSPSPSPAPSPTVTPLPGADAGR